jgi:hypothetical protein
MPPSDKVKTRTNARCRLDRLVGKTVRIAACEPCVALEVGTVTGVCDNEFEVFVQIPGRRHACYVDWPIAENRLEVLPDKTLLPPVSIPQP